MRAIPPQRQQFLPVPSDTEAELGYPPISGEPQLRDYWKMLAKRRRLVMVVVAATVSIGILVTALSPRLYTTSVTLQIDANLPSVAGTWEGGVRSDDYYQTQLALLKSRALAAKVINELGLASNPNFVVVQDPIEHVRSQVWGLVHGVVRHVSDVMAPLRVAAPVPAARPAASDEFELGVHPRYISRYLRLLAVEPVRNTSLATVRFTTIDPQLSQQLAAAHATAFIRMNLETRFELTEEAREFLEKKVAELKVKVEKSEAALQRFRQRHGVVSLEGTQNIVVDRMVDLNKRLTEARARRIELESLRQIVKDRNVEYLSQVIGNTLILQLKGRIEDLEAEQARLATIYKGNHPRLQELRQQITEGRRRLRLEISNVVRGIETDFASARAQEAALQAEAERQQQAALDLKELGVQFTLLQSEFDANRTIYESVARRLNETSLASDSPITNIHIVEPAEMPLGPSSPNVTLNMMLATTVGLFLAIGLAFLAEHFDSSMRTPEDLWRATALPTLGVVPQLRSLARREYGLSSLSKSPPLRRLAHRWAAEGQSFSPSLMLAHPPLSFLAESYRSIRTILLLGQGDRSPRVVLITSAHPGEGKTTITLNLGIALAQSGRSVVVVDADLRKGNCHSHLAIPNRRGLTHILTDGLPLDVCVQSTAVTGFSLLPRGVAPSNPTEILGSNEMRELLTALRQRFDFVMIDTPPAIAISDAMVLSAWCDGVLLVVRNQNTTTDAVRHVVDRLQAVGAPIVGAVLNGINLRDPYYADYRHYYASYHAAAQQDAEPQG